MLIATLAVLIVTLITPQEPVKDVSSEYARAYQLQPISPQRWREGCEVRWNLSNSGDFTAQAGMLVTQGKWRVEETGPAGPQTRTVLVLEGLIENGGAGCGVVLPEEPIRLDIMSLRDGTVFVINRQLNSDGVPRVSPQVRLEPQD